LHQAILSTADVNLNRCFNSIKSLLYQLTFALGKTSDFAGKIERVPIEEVFHSLI